jgi:hypothetical protein
MPRPVTVVASGAPAFVAVSDGPPATPAISGPPITLVSTGAPPICLVDDAGGASVYRYGVPFAYFDFIGGLCELNGVRSGLSSVAGYSFSRAHTNFTSAYAQTAAGVLVPFAAAAPRITDRGLLIEGARTNKSTNYNAAPNGSLTNVIKFGDAAATLTEVDDSAALAAAGLQNICPSGKVFKLDNTAGVAAAVAWCAGVTGNTNTHTASAYVRGGTGSFAQYSAGGTPYGAWAASSSYVRRVGTFTPVDASRVCAIVADAGQVVYFILNQLEEGGFVSSPIVVAGASATRAADVCQVAFTPPSPAWTVFGSVEWPASSPVNAISLEGGLTSLSGFTLAKSSSDATIARAIQRTGTTRGDAVSSPFTNGQTVKSVLSSDATFAFNGSSASSVATPSQSDWAEGITIGGRWNSTAQWFGYIKQIAIYSSILSAAQKQAITS